LEVSLFKRIVRPDKANALAVLIAAWMSGLLFGIALLFTGIGIPLWILVILYSGALFHFFLAWLYLPTVKQSPDKKAPIENPHDKSQPVSGGLVPTESRPTTEIDVLNNNCQRRPEEKNDNIRNNPDNPVAHCHAPSCDSGVTSDREHSIAGGAPKKEVHND
jgi:hypothetical protein